MKKGLKRVLCLCFALCLVFSTTACGGKDTNTANEAGNQQGNVNSSQSGATVVPPVPEVDPNSKYNDPNWSPYAQIPESSKGVTVRYAGWGDPTQGSSVYVYANIKNDIGIGLEHFMVPQSGYVNTIMTKTAIGDAPDIFMTNEGAGAFPLTLQIAAPINKVSTVDLNDPIFDQSYLATATIEGNVYLLQTIGSPHSNGNLVFYNKTLFSDNGFKSPEDYYNEGTWTWDNMLKCLKDVKSLGKDFTGAHLEMDIMTGSVGTSFVKYDYKTATYSNNVSDPNLKAAYEWYVDAKSQGLLDGSMDKFIQGKCGIVIRGVFGLDVIGYWKDMDFKDIGFTYLPSFEEGKKGYISAIYGGRGIVENAPNADAAGYVIRYMLDPANYDLDNSFISVEAGNFYYTLVDAPADEKYFNHDAPCAYASGQNGMGVFMNPAMNVASAAQVNTKLQEVSPLVDLAVEAGNKIIQDKIAADKIKYK